MIGMNLESGMMNDGHAGQLAETTCHGKPALVVPAHPDA